MLRSSGLTKPVGRFHCNELINTNWLNAVFRTVTYAKLYYTCLIPRSNNIAYIIALLIYKSIWEYDDTMYKPVDTIFLL